MSKPFRPLSVVIKATMTGEFSFLQRVSY